MAAKKEKSGKSEKGAKPSKAKNTPKAQPSKKISALTFSEIKGLGPRVKFYVRKKYRAETKTTKEWGKVFESDGLI